MPLIIQTSSSPRTCQKPLPRKSFDLVNNPIAIKWFGIENTISHLPNGPHDRVPNQAQSPLFPFPFSHAQKNKKSRRDKRGQVATIICHPSHRKFSYQTLWEKGHLRNRCKVDSSSLSSLKVRRRIQLHDRR